MDNEKDIFLKMVMKNGHAFTLIGDQATVDEMVSHPKFMRVRDQCNDIFVSIEDVSAFEILNNRKELPKPPENNGDQPPIQESIQQA